MLYALAYLVQLLALMVGVLIGTGAVGGAVFIVALEAMAGARLADRIRASAKVAKLDRAMGKPTGGVQ